MDVKKVESDGNFVLAISRLALLYSRYIQTVETPQFLRSSYRASLLYE
jgi:hypothetical protein